MNYKATMNQVKELLNSWKSDDDVMSTYTHQELQRQMLNCIQVNIKSSFVIITREELEKMQKDYYLEQSWNF